MQFFFSSISKYLSSKNSQNILICYSVNPAWRRTLKARIRSLQGQYVYIHSFIYAVIVVNIVTNYLIELLLFEVLVLKYHNIAFISYFHCFKLCSKSEKKEFLKYLYG